MGYSFLIVDDEELCRRYIRSLVTEFVPDAVLMDASSAQSALELIETEKVDVLFLDIRMAGMSGFEMLNKLGYRNFKLVFTTAYNKYAIDAIKEGASDYILKPIKKTEFKETLYKLVCKLDEEEQLRRDILLHSPKGKIIISQQSGTILVSVEEIMYLEANNSYTTFYLANGKKITASKAIIYFERVLDPVWFFRIHKSYIINFHHFKEYNSKDGHYVVMQDGKHLHVSRYRMSEFHQAMRHYLPAQT